MSAYSKTPLAKKLGIKEKFTILVINQPDNYWDLLTDLPTVEVENEETSKSLDFIHLFVTDLEEMQQLLLKWKPRLKLNGTLWISWPKKASKMPTNVDKWNVMEAGQAIGLVDVKVAAIDDIWSGHKFVYRTKDRK